jgi:general secretion pathway protein H
LETARQSSLVRCPPSGFTLLELIIVMVLATLILGLSTLFFANSLPAARLGAAGREVASAIRHAKALSETSGEDQALIINLDTRQYGPQGGIMKDLPAGISVRIEDPLNGEIREGQFTLLFYGIGGMDGGTVLLSNGRKSLSIRTDPIAGTVIS